MCAGGRLSAQYDWSVANVQYKALQADVFGSAPSGSYTDSVSLPIHRDKLCCRLNATLAFTPLIAGYWQVTVHCAVFVLDTKEGLSWNDYPGTGNAGPQDLTSATVSFSPNPIETGADEEPHQQGAIFAKVTATVVPKDLVSDISVNNFTTLPQGTGAAAIENSQPDYSTGQIAFDLYGTAGTAPSMPNGDVEIDAKDGSAVLGSAMVIIEIPKAIGTPHPQVNPGVAVAPQNVDLSATSVPAWQGVPAGEVLLGTLVEVAQTIPIVDQFGNKLSGLYNGQIVDEGFNGSFVSINVKINNGTYQDHVGFEGDHGVELPPTNMTAIGWPTSTEHCAIPSPQSKSGDATVQVAGFPLSPSITNRTLSYSNGVLTVTWP